VKPQPVNIGWLIYRTSYDSCHPRVATSTSETSGPYRFVRELSIYWTAEKVESKSKMCGFDPASNPPLCSEMQNLDIHLMASMACPSLEIIG
jgi:hypothetical protein